jgi:hypothetical protein
LLSGISRIHDENFKEETRKVLFCNVRRGNGDIYLKGETRKMELP